MTDNRRVTGWRKSSRSANQTNCVEVGSTGDGAAVRDTKDREGGYFTASSGQWANFMAAIKDGRFPA